MWIEQWCRGELTNTIVNLTLMTREEAHMLKLHFDILEKGIFQLSIIIHLRCLYYHLFWETSIVVG